MPFVSKKDKLVICDDDLKKLVRISRSRKEGCRSERAEMLLLFFNGETISAIARRLKTNRVKVERCVNKALCYGALTALDDLPRKGRPPEISAEAKAWVLSIARMKPKDLGLPLEIWTQRALAKYLRDHCESDGYGSLKKISCGTVSKMLAKSSIKPHKIEYYMQKRDSNFEEKMSAVLHVYKEVEMYQSAEGSEKFYVSYDEKPSIQAIGNVSPDLPPQPGKNGSIKRDCHYRRHGTLSLLASIDLLTGRIYAKAYDRHRSEEFIDFLKHHDAVFPKGVKIKVILDNHSSHTSKKTREYLSTVPNRFEFIFTPKHGSWLNIIEVFFSKMTRSLLRGIRVESKAELKERIDRYVEEINEMPTIFRWRWKMEEITL